MRSFERRATPRDAGCRAMVEVDDTEAALEFIDQAAAGDTEGSGEERSYERRRLPARRRGHRDRRWSTTSSSSAPRTRSRRRRRRRRRVAGRERGVHAELDGAGRRRPARHRLPRYRAPRSRPRRLRGRRAKPTPGSEAAARRAASDPLAIRLSATPATSRLELASPRSRGEEDSPPTRRCSSALPGGSWSPSRSPDFGAALETRARRSSRTAACRGRRRSSSDDPRMRPGSTSGRPRSTGSGTPRPSSRARRRPVHGRADRRDQRRQGPAEAARASSGRPPSARPACARPRRPTAPTRVLARPRRGSAVSAEVGRIGDSSRRRGGGTVAEALEPSATLGDDPRLPGGSRVARGGLRRRALRPAGPAASSSPSERRRRSDPDYQAAKPYLEALDCWSRARGAEATGLALRPG